MATGTLILLSFLSSLLSRQTKEDLEAAHRRELEKFKAELEQEKARVLAVEAVNSSLEGAHMEEVERLNRDFKEEVEALRNIMDSSHGDQVKELRDLLEERHRKVSQY